MNPLPRQYWNELAGWFRPETPGPLVGSHVIHTGIGELLTDRWPRPEVVLADCSGNYQLMGNPEAISPEELRALAPGFLQADGSFLPALRRAFTGLWTWPRIILELIVENPFASQSSFDLLRLTPENTPSLSVLSPEIQWISKTWGGPAGLAGSGCAWTAFMDGRAASIACTFFYGEKFEDIGIVTELAFRGRSLATGCAAAHLRDIFARGHIPSWGTSPDNEPSLRIACKLGFQHLREDVLYVIGRPVPKSAVRLLS